MCCQVCLQVSSLKEKIKRLATEDIKEVGNFVSVCYLFKNVCFTVFCKR